jgi:hypothetical protein
MIQCAWCCALPCWDGLREVLLCLIRGRRPVFVEFEIGRRLVRCRGLILCCCFALRGPFFRWSIFYLSAGWSESNTMVEFPKHLKLSLNLKLSYYPTQFAVDDFHNDAFIAVQEREGLFGCHFEFHQNFERSTSYISINNPSTIPSPVVSQQSDLKSLKSAI